MLVCQRKRHHNIWYILLNPSNANIVGILATAFFFGSNTSGRKREINDSKKQQTSTQNTYKQHTHKHQYRANTAVFDILFL